MPPEAGMNHEWLFLKMRSSNDLLGDPAALAARLDEDSYLYFEQVLDPAKIRALRQAMLEVLAGHGWVKGFLSLRDGLAVCRPLHEGMADYAPTYDAIQRLEAFHTLAHDENLLAIMSQVVGPSAFPHPLKICRLGFPEHYEATTPPHQDYPNNQGTKNLTAAWIPVGDVPMDLGGVAILRGSHRWGVLPLAGHMGPGRRQAKLPAEMLEQLRWVTTDYACGDVLLFPSQTVHAALHNITEFDLRLSVDFRYQVEGEALTDVCLHPHFQRLTWPDVYRGWESDRYQYYWKGLDYQVVPFEEYPVDGGSDEGADELGFTPEDWVTIMTVDKRWESRYQRRIERLAEVTGEPVEEPTADQPG
jgi:ectoine hydroxylase-related dioxygenase (phytanoyl-CoA dioxygenase family)